MPLERLTAALAERYRVERELGAGGMATVYLAADLKHDRKVAIKVLKPELAAVLGADRFVQEIKTTASLTHPHILPLFDSGEADGFLYYVMPYLEGETIRERLNRDTQLDVAEAVRITTEVADALEYAHRHGVIHRDIKPENILLHEGRPMVMDFGIALAVSAAAGGRMTETGLSLGTPHYMSPEQATAAKSITGRSDIYSLACVLYEMLAGEPPHTGPTAQAIIMKIVAEPVPEITTQRPSVPANVAAALAKALERLPADRFESAKAFADALADPVFTTVKLKAASTSAMNARGVREWLRNPWSWAALATLLVVAATPMLRQGDTSPGRAAVVRFAVRVDPDTGRGHDPYPFPLFWTTGLAISPDGSRLVYGAWGPDSTFNLYQRRWDQAKSEMLLSAPKGEPNTSPFFSPDGLWVGFINWKADGVTLRRMRLSDGLTETIGSVSAFTPGVAGVGAYTGLSRPTWGDDGTIVLSTTKAVYRIPASGGEWKRMAEVPADTGLHVRWYQPHLLPGSRTLLLHSARSLNPEDSDIIALDLATGGQRTVIANAMNPLYLASGYLLFVRQGVLMGVRFDASRAMASGEPVVLMDDVMQAVGMYSTAQETGAAQFAVSAGGSVAYARGGGRQSLQLRVVRVTPRGDSIPIDMERREWILFRLSPDASRLAAVSRRGQRQEVWVHDLARGVTRSLNVGGFWNWPLEWSPDGRSLIVSSDREHTGRFGVYRMPADGSGTPENVVPAAPSSDVTNAVGSWSSQGTIAYVAGPLGNYDIWVIPPDSQPRPFVKSDSADFHPAFSPDGNWLAYDSNLSGRMEVYVRPYPGGEPVTQVSTSGGGQPVWSRDGRTLFFINFQGGMLAVDIAPGQVFRPGPVRRLAVSNMAYFIPVRPYDIFPDGSFVTQVYESAANAPPTGVSELQVILNFGTLVAERVGKGK